MRVCRRHPWEICSLRGATSVPGTAARRQAPTRGPCRNLKRKTPMHKHEDNSCRHRRESGGVHVINNVVVDERTYIQQVLGWDAYSQYPCLHGKRERPHWGNRKFQRDDVCNRHGKNRARPNWGPTLSALGISDGREYTDYDMLSGSVKNMAVCATNAVDCAFDFVGGCCRAAGAIGKWLFCDDD